MRYRIEYSPETEGHLRALTKSRKLMRPNPMAPWELRIGSLRVYYDVDENEYAVYILAVGVKERNNVKIGKEVIKL